VYSTKDGDHILKVKINTANQVQVCRKISKIFDLSQQASKYVIST
jgi:hypothetical protein